MWKKSVLGILVALVLALGLVAAQTADACCVYNDTGLEIKAAWHLASDWHLSPNSHKCENGKGGTLDVIDDKHWAKDIPICMSVGVDHHGYVKIKQDDNTFYVTSYRKNGTVRDKCTRTIYSATKPELPETK